MFVYMKPLHLPPFLFLVATSAFVSVRTLVCCVLLCAFFLYKVTVLGLVALWFRQVREAERANGVSLDALSLPDKSKLFEALQRLPISFGMAMRVRDTDIPGCARGACRP